MLATVVSDDGYLAYDFGDHPLNPRRLEFTISLARELGVLDNVAVLAPASASDAELLTIHDSDYLHAVRTASTDNSFRGFGFLCVQRCRVGDPHPAGGSREPGGPETDSWTTAILEATRMSAKSWHILDPDECWALLEARHLGRLAFVDQHGPIVLPINYAVVGGVVIFRTDAGGKLDAAVRGDRLAFEIDGFDALEQTGWSVLVRGAAELVTDEAELGLLQGLPLVSWAPGVKPIYVRLGAAEVTGRRINAPDLPARWWG